MSFYTATWNHTSMSPICSSELFSLFEELATFFPHVPVELGNKTTLQTMDGSKYLHMNQMILGKYL